MVFQAISYTGIEINREKNLDSLEQRFPRDDFFRANRQYLVSIKSIAEASNYFNGM